MEKGLGWTVVDPELISPKFKVKVGNDQATIPC